ncbi:MAG: type II secretion system F family protein [Hyphomicrobiales bacterium]
MLDPQIVQLAVMALAALSIGGIVYVVVMPFLGSERRASKRLELASKGVGARKVRGVPEQLSTRKRQVEDTIKELENKQKKKKKISLTVRLLRAGLNVPTRSFYIASLVTGFLIAAVVFITGSPPVIALAAGFAGALGLPRWLLSYLTKRRQKKFLTEFANALDVVVRGVKSGLPLNDCLQIIATETPEPVRGEFADLVEQQRVGVPLSRAFERMHDRMPLQEVNFFAIVIAIQQQTGGNLAETLGNLAAVLRDRQRLNAKVQAFSAEAKASAVIIGSLPVIVMTLIFITTPDYISILWTEPLGKVMLGVSAFWMLCGTLVMRKMINFDY